MSPCAPPLSLASYLASPPRNFFNEVFCADYKNDVNFCGGCDKFCADGMECIDGNCFWPEP